MTYSCVVISVADIQRSRRFYEELFGLTVQHNYGINVAFDCGIALQQEFDWLVGVPKHKVLDNANNFELCFEEEHFDAFLVKLKENPDVRFVHDVVEYGWEQRVVRFYDPDNHIVEVGESMKTVVNRFLSTGLTVEETAEKMGISPADVETILR